MANISPKEIAQTFVLNEIVVHEIILDAIQLADNFIEKTSILTLTKGDMIRLILNYASKQDDLKTIFNISDSDIFRTIKSDYENEITILIEKFNQKK